jgi:hypothetical protein
LLLIPLDAGFGTAGTHCRLARAAIVIDHIPAAKEMTSLACEHHPIGPAYIPQRIHFFQVVFALLDGGDPTERLRNLKLALLPPRMRSWSGILHAFSIT